MLFRCNRRRSDGRRHDNCRSSYRCFCIRYGRKPPEVQRGCGDGIQTQFKRNPHHLPRWPRMLQHSAYGLVTITPPGIAETVTYFNTSGETQANTTNGSQVVATPSVTTGCSGGSCPLAITGNIITSGSSQGVLGAIVGDWVMGTPSVPNGFSESCHIIVTGYFIDGSSQVILDTQI